jgi:nucleotide-binding universal stress UspA family protein
LTGGDFKETIMDDIKKIMVALGFSEYAEGIFNYADMLAAKLGAELIVANIINARDVEAVTVITNMGYELDPERYISELKEERRSAFEAIAKKASLAQDSIKLVLQVGNPIDELLKIIQDQNVDLVVMGVKGRTDLEHILIGSVAEKLFRRAPVTVISYRDEKNRQRLRKRTNLT